VSKYSQGGGTQEQIDQYLDDDFTQDVSRRRKINDHSADNMDLIHHESMDMSNHSNERWLNHALDEKPKRQGTIVD
jgi:hypothetical protein